MKEDKFKKCRGEFLNVLEPIIRYVPNNDKYPLYELRKICNQFAIRKKESEEVCDEDKLSKAGLIGYYFNNYRKSGFNNTVLHNVIMRETTKDDLENKKQCIGRSGRKTGPIISLSYVDSSKVGNPQETKELLENGSPFSSTAKKKIALVKLQMSKFKNWKKLLSLAKTQKMYKKKF